MRLRHVTVMAACIGMVFVACEKDKLIGKKAGKNPSMQLRTDDSPIEAFFAEGRAARTEVFEAYVQEEGARIETESGIIINIAAGSLVNPDGSDIQGPIRVEVTAAFNAGAMAGMNRTTEGRNVQASEEAGTDIIAPMISGGEFKVRITNQDGEEVVAVEPVEVLVPTNATGGDDPDMDKWLAVESPEQERDIVWEKVEDEQVEIVRGGKGETSYFKILINTWDWTNIDKFYNIPGDKTEVICYMPAGFDNTNAEVYMSFVGQPNALASLDTWTGNYFSEHYGQINVFTHVNYIAVIEDNGQMMAAIHEDVEIQYNHVETFDISEFNPTDQATMENDINNLP